MDDFAEADFALKLLIEKKRLKPRTLVIYQSGLVNKLLSKVLNFSQKDIVLKAFGGLVTELKEKVQALRLRQKIAFGSLSIVSLLGVTILPLNSNSKNLLLFSPVPKELTLLKNTSHEVFGFAPFWTINKLDNVDFNVLTTFAYFGVPLDSDGNFVQDDPGYTTFVSEKATQVFQKAHENGTRVVLTITQMDNFAIENFLSSIQAQDNAINQAVYHVKERGIDGVNVDIEYSGNPGDNFRNEFSLFVKKMTDTMHREIPNSKVTVSVYAASAKEPMLYDINKLAQNSDGIFMMAYDFAQAGSDKAMPTAPLSGHKQGKYFYDIMTAVDDFLKVMPEDKLILGVPYYGYNYPVYEPKIKAETTYYYNGVAQTYTDAQENLNEKNPEIADYFTGWDKDGQVGWKAYFDDYSGSWRMLFLEDERSLKLKYAFAKEKGLSGVGIWALGFDSNRKELWNLLRKEFGAKIANKEVTDKPIKDNI